MQINGEPIPIKVNISFIFICKIQNWNVTFVKSERSFIFNKVLNALSGCNGFSGTLQSNFDGIKWLTDQSLRNTWREKYMVIVKISWEIKNFYAIYERAIGYLLSILQCNLCIYRRRYSWRDGDDGLIRQWFPWQK